jgi:hypothetical protein
VRTRPGVAFNPRGNRRLGRRARGDARLLERRQKYLLACIYYTVYSPNPTRLALPGSGSAGSGAEDGKPEVNIGNHENQP